MKKHYTTFSDYELQKFLIKGDSKAFEEIFNRYWKRLYAYAFRIYEEEKICEDIVQEVFINLWERKSSAEILNLEGYLFRAIKYRLANHIRNLKFTRVHENVLSEIPYTDSASRKMEFEDFRDELFQSIDNLPPRCRQIFLLSRVDHLSNAEIAEKFNISKRTVETHISNALKILKDHLPTCQIPLIISTLFLEC